MGQQNKVTLVRHSAIRRECTVGAFAARSRWGKLSVTVFAAMVLGAAAAAIGSKRELISPAVRDAHSVKAYVIPPLVDESISVSAVRRAHVEGVDGGELKRLQIRNRRLEALVTVLRERAEHQTEVAIEKRTPATVTDAGQ